MAWSIDQVYSFFKFHLRKNQAGGISSTDLFYAWNTEQAMYHNDLVGRWQIRANGKTGQNTGMVMNETVLTELAPFIINQSISISAGKVTKPADFIYTADVRIGNYKVMNIKPDQVSEILNSVIDPPNTAEHTYYYTEYEDYYQLFPTNLTGTATVDYVASATDVVWGYTIDGNGRQVYDPNTSVQPQWLQNTIITICKRTLTSFGVSFKDKDFEEFGRIAQQTGD